MAGCTMRTWRSRSPLALTDRRPSSPATAMRSRAATRTMSLWPTGRRYPRCPPSSTGSFTSARTTERSPHSVSDRLMRSRFPQPDVPGHTSPEEGATVDDQIEYGFTTAVFVLEHATDKLTPAEADSNFTEVTKENFWRMWPAIREWAESLWQRLEDERGAMSRPALDEEVDDVGGGG